MTLHVRPTTTTTGKEYTMIYAGNRPVATLHFATSATALAALLRELEKIIEHNRGIARPQKEIW